MSHWLSNVNNLLTKLDDQVETVVEERAFAQDDSSYEAIGAARTGIDDILAKRGLSSMNSKDDTEEKPEETRAGMKIVEEGKDHEVETQSLGFQNNEERPEEVEQSSEPVVELSKNLVQSLESDTTNNVAKKDTHRNVSNKLETNSSPSGKPGDGKLENDDTISAVLSKEVESAERESVETGGSNSSTISTLLRLKDKQTPSGPPSLELEKYTKSLAPTLSASSSMLSEKEQKRSNKALSPDRSKKEIRDLAIERKEAQKEARTLRRHIVSLNDQLETAEAELQAQRKELERAADRMEKDRVRHREEKEVSQKRSDTEIVQLKAQHEKSMEDQQARFEEQLERYRKKLSIEEQRRKQEGGDWNKEMSNAIDREQETRRTLTLLEDEKAVLLSQITTLQGQQAALGSRLESLSQAADNAMERERDAENRLDVALNQHARQISHRQARELQLERTIQDLNAALVQSRGKVGSTCSNSSISEVTSKNPQRDNSLMEARIRSLESDLQSANSHLAIEKERSETLQIQLRSFSNESTQEANVIHAKEVEYDRQIADLSTTISTLEAKIRRYERVTVGNQNRTAESLDGEQMPNQIKNLSEEVLRLRDKIANHNSEYLAMKNRLKAAVDRSNRLEDELQTVKLSTNSDGRTSEQLGHGYKQASSGKRRHLGASNSSSIRTAMLLNSTHGDRTEQIGQVVDQIDSFAASTGKYLRRNPLARAGFIFYLVMIHLWTFVLLFFHAHSFDTNAGSDFGGNFGQPHGPHAIFQQHKSLNTRQLPIDTSQSPPT